VYLFSREASKIEFIAAANTTGGVRSPPPPGYAVRTGERLVVQSGGLPPDANREETVDTTGNN